MTTQRTTPRAEKGNLTATQKGISGHFGAFRVALSNYIRGSRKLKTPLKINDIQRLSHCLAEWTGLEPATAGVTG